LVEEEEELATLGINNASTPSSSPSSSSSPSPTSLPSLSSLTMEERHEHRQICGRHASRGIQIMVMNAMLVHYNRNSTVGQHGSLITSAVAPSTLTVTAAVAAATVTAGVGIIGGTSTTSGLSTIVSGVTPSLGATPIGRTTHGSSSSSSSSHTTTTAGLLRIVIDHINHRRLRAKLRRLLAALTPLPNNTNTNNSNNNGNNNGNGNNNPNDDMMSNEDESLSNQPKVRLHSATPSNVFAFSIVSSDHRCVHQLIRTCICLIN
jgi:hypothetical protein